MSKDPFKPTKEMLDDKQFTSFLDRCVEIRRENGMEFNGAFNPSNGVLYD